ncbi:MAG: four helix bundle protein [Gemmatimonadaceae bacterium]
MSLARHLAVYRKSNALAARVLQATSAVGDHADLTQRVRQVVVAISLAIDAGANAESPGEFASYLRHARTLLRETDWLLELLPTLAVIPLGESTRLRARVALIQRMVSGLLRVVEVRGAARLAAAATRDNSRRVAGDATVRRRASARPVPSG